MNIELKNIFALISDNEKYEVKKTNIFIKDGVIAEIGESYDGFVPEKVIDGEDKLVIPGLVNAHTHAYMSMFRNKADDLTFEEWLFKNIMPREDKLLPEDAYWAAKLSCIEMIKTGTTCFLDMHMHKGQTAKAAFEVGNRAVVSRGISGSDRKDEGVIRRVDEALDEVDCWKDKKRISFMLAPHAIYTCGTDCLNFVIETAHDKKLPLHIHLSETRQEVSDSKKNYNMTPVEYLNKLGFFDIKTVAAHCVHLEDNDFKILKEKNVNVAANPKSNLKLGNGFAPIFRMINDGINVCIGTDSSASNNSLNLFSDMNYTALIHKGTSENPQAVSAVDAFRAATVNGARALGINAGEIKVGKAADLAILDLNCPQMRPKNNLLAALAYSANGSEVETVIIDGEIVMENRKMCNVDEKEVYDRVEKIAERIQ